MNLLPSERLTIEFYGWEVRMRGWNEYSAPVDLEPPFEPFLVHKVGQHKDDGSVPGFFDRLKTVFFPPPKEEEEKEVSDLAPILDTIDEELVVVKVIFPEHFKYSLGSMEQCLVMLSSSISIISFELYAKHDLVRYQFVCIKREYRLLMSQLNTFFPECLFEKTVDVFPYCIETYAYYNIREYGLKEEVMRPLAKGKSAEGGTFSGVFGHLRDIPEGEAVYIQVLFKGVVNPWVKSIVLSVQDNHGGSFFEDAPELVHQAKDKVSSLLFACTIRMVVFAETEDAVLSLGGLVEDALVRGTASQANRLTLLPLRENKGSYGTDIHKRKSHRLGFLLNIGELSSFVHFPSGTTSHLKLETITTTTKKAPESVVGENYVLGTNTHNGTEVVVSLSQEKRLRHIHIIGGTGTGKSTLLLNLIHQDITKGTGLCVLDPHGDLIDSILVSIPKHRISDVIVLDPSDQHYPVSFNILKAHSDLEKDILSSDLVASFRKLSTSWGDQMNSVFSNAILAFLENTEVGTLSDLRRFLVDERFRRSVLKNVVDTSVSYYWYKEYPLLKSSSIGPILTRLDTFLRPKLIRYMVAQKDSLDFGRVLNENKIVLVKLSHGIIGAENSHLLGSVVVSKIHQAATGRQVIKKEERKPYFLYIDEFQHFTTPSMESILSGARKYGLGMILAHQDLGQVHKSSPEVYTSLFSNVGTRICFRVSVEDARKLEEGFSYFTAKDLQNLRRGQAIVRSDRASDDFNLDIMAPQALPEVHFKDEILIRSRMVYGRPRALVEEALNESFSVEVEGDKKEKPIATPIEKIPQVESSDTTVKDTVSTISLEDIPLPKTSKEKTLHRYTQMLIKKMAESIGYVATLERQLENGGKVDVSLENNALRIACEICATTTKEWELHNIQKCCEAGYDYVISCAPERKVLEKIQKMVLETLEEHYRERVVFLEPAEVITFLDNLHTETPKEETRMKGYRVKVNYENISDQDMKSKKEAIAKVVVDSIRKMKKE